MIIPFYEMRLQSRASSRKSYSQASSRRDSQYIISSEGFYGFGSKRCPVTFWGWGITLRYRATASRKK